ncbi:MAG TPA: ADP-heptose--LPS heptosyltransferase [Thermoanaerobaculia bacterium]|jgi:hypothetical protein
MRALNDEQLAHEWLARMRRGDFAGAWLISDEVLRRRAPDWTRPRHEQPVWDGTPLDGKRVLIRCYHGLGDTIQFIRYAPLVKEIAREVIVWAQPSLIPLLATMPSIDQLLPLHDGAPEIAYDIDVEVMELPYIFRSTLETLPANVPYLLASTPRNSEEPEELRGTRIGLVWKAGDWDTRRSIPRELLEPLFAIEGLAFQSLQQDAIDGPLPTARLIQSLELVISVDTFPAHLAGALGVPVWTLLPFEADWRWMSDRDDSPWYPTMRLFRQSRDGDWAEAVARVASALSTKAREWRAKSSHATPNLRS